MTNPIFDDVNDEEFPDDISFTGFDFGKYYEHEDTILRPQLELYGYYAITFEMGECDSFGPLTRVCVCIDSFGKKRQFVYG